MQRLRHKDIPEAKALMLEAQNWRCGICQRDLKKVEPKNRCLDHSHLTGQLRAVCCRQCNSGEGRIWNWANRSKQDMKVLDWLRACMAYIEEHEANPSGVYHPTHLTDEEKRIKRNKKARARARKKRETKNQR